MKGVRYKLANRMQAQEIRLLYMFTIFKNKYRYSRKRVHTVRASICLILFIARSLGELARNKKSGVNKDKIVSGKRNS